MLSSVCSVEELASKTNVARFSQSCDLPIWHVLSEVKLQSHVVPLGGVKAASVSIYRSDSLKITPLKSCWSAQAFILLKDDSALQNTTHQNMSAIALADPLGGASQISVASSLQALQLPHTQGINFTATRVVAFDFFYTIRTKKTASILCVDIFFKTSLSVPCCALPLRVALKRTPMLPAWLISAPAAWNFYYPFCTFRLVKTTIQKHFHLHDFSGVLQTVWASSRYLLICKTAPPDTC